jgi:cell division septum initiation protein DivIVA
MRTDIEYDRFPIAKRGYDPHAVEAFLELSVSENDRMLNEAAAQIAALELELEEARKQEEAVHLTILAATKAKEDMLTAAQHKANDIAERARKEGDRLVTDARMQAFKLVTGAREEAETIVGEARVEAAAIARVQGAQPDEPAGPSDAEVALQARIEAMQGVIQAMEIELATRPTTADPRPSPVAGSTEPRARASEPSASEADGEASREDGDAAPESPSPESPDDAIEVVVVDAPTSEDAHEPEPVDPDEPLIRIDPTTEDDDAPPIAASATDEEAVAEDRTPEAIRRSFYSRRSAKLPQIGNDAGRGAMAAVAGLRTHLTEPEATDDTNPEPSPAFEAV